jgi:hypothetical protein
MMVEIFSPAYLVLTRPVGALWTAQGKSLKKWRAGQNKTANTYIIEISL